MPFGAKTNERPGTRAQARHVRMSAYKAREVLDLIRGAHVADAEDILAFVERDAAIVIRKVLASAIANAQANDEQDPDQLFVSACYADEGPTMKRWRPRARGRATRIRKRTCHITVIVSRMSDEDLARRNARAASATAGSGRKASARAAAGRSARVARSRAKDSSKAGIDPDATESDESTEAVDTSEAVVDQTSEAGEGEADQTSEAGDAVADASPSSDTDETQVGEAGEGEAVADQNSEAEANVKEADVPEEAKDTDATADDKNGEI